MKIREAAGAVSTSGVCPTPQQSASGCLSCFAVGLVVTERSDSTHSRRAASEGLGPVEVFGSRVLAALIKAIIGDHIVVYIQEHKHLGRGAARNRRESLGVADANAAPLLRAAPIRDLQHLGHFPLGRLAAAIVEARRFERRMAREPLP